MSFFRPISQDANDISGGLAQATRAIRSEGGDAPANTATPYRMQVGDTFNGAITGFEPGDWVRVTLQPGIYRIDLDGHGSLDPYLRVFDASGRNLVTQNDDRDYAGRDYDSAVTLNVTRAATYYVSASSYNESSSGAYSLEVARLPVFSIGQIAQQLTDGYWQGTGGGRRSFDVDPGQVLNVDLSGLAADGRRLAVAALQAWTDVTGIRFNANGTGTAHITFDDNYANAYSTSTTFGSTISSSFVNVSTQWLVTEGSSFDSYGYQTYIHEIGHALGLGHSGNYNGSGNYDTQSHYANDSWQATIMSYFDQDQNFFVNASRAYIVSAMMADIAAMRTLYGNANLRMGDTVYGEASNAGGNYARISGLLAGTARDNIAFTIVDSGGIDTLNLSGDNTNQRLTLVAGGISDAYGLIGNIGIMSGTSIENLRAGSGHDVLTGNALNNMIWGNGGNDRIFAGAGNDSIAGGAGRDTMQGGIGNDTYQFDGRDVIIELANAGRDTVVANAGNVTLGANLENLVLTAGRAQDGNGNALANILNGNAFANTLRGFAGTDRLNGAGGNDVLIGGLGNDTMAGGAGADIFVFTHARDLIVDFQNDIDTIRIDDAIWGGGARTVAQVLQSARVVNGDTVITLGNGHVLTLDNYTNIQSLANDLAII